MAKLQRYTPAQIAKITDVRDAVNLKKMADAAKLFYAAQDRQIDAQEAKKVSMEAARRAGEILAETPREKGKRTDLGTSLGTSITRYARLLDDTGISPSTARNWQKMARISEEKLESYFAEAEYMNWEYTHYSLMRYADGKRTTELDHEDFLRLARRYCDRLQGSAASAEIQLAARRFLGDT